MSEAIQDIPLARIACDNQVRSGEYDEQELIGLAITIREVGQLFPIRVRPTGDSYAIVDGHRRYLAAMRLKRPTIAAIVDKELGEGEVLHRQWVGNCQRTPVDAVDSARAIKRLMDVTSWNATETAKRLGVPGATISRAMSLLSLPEPIVKQVETGSLAPSTACELAKIADPAKQAELAQAAANGEVTRDAVSGEVKREKNGQPTEEPSGVRRAVAVLGDGRSVAVSGAGLTLDTLIVWLEELLAKARKARTRGVDLTTFTRLLKQQAKG